MILSAAKETDVNSLGHTLRNATKHGFEVNTTFKIMFLERPDHKVVLEVNNAQFSTKTWCLNFEADGKNIRIPQTLSKECVERNIMDVRQLLGKMKRMNIMVKTKGKDGERVTHWTYWYAVPAV